MSPKSLKEEKTGGRGRPLTAQEKALKLQLKSKISKQPPRKSTRIRIPNTDVVLAGLRYVVEPTYQPAPNCNAGGSRSSAILGPSAFVSRNSDADARLPGAIDDARALYGIDFKAGHLLNAQFGGAGTDPANLAILTPTANGIHRGFDEPLKQALDALDKAYRALVRLNQDVRALNYGIQVVVSTTGYYWDQKYPGNCIPTGLLCSAQVVNRPDTSNFMRQDLASWDRLVTEANHYMSLVDLKVAEAQLVNAVPNTQ